MSMYVFEMGSSYVSLARLEFMTLPSYPLNSVSYGYASPTTISSVLIEQVDI